MKTSIKTQKIAVCGQMQNFHRQNSGNNLIKNIDMIKLLVAISYWLSNFDISEIILQAFNYNITDCATN